MVDKFYNGVIEQVYDQIGKTDKNIVMASYNNEFSVKELDNIKRYSEASDNVFFAWYEFEYGRLTTAFDPFWNIICDMYRTYINGKFEDFLVECEVYQLQRETLCSYYYTGECKRNESVLLDEVDYEQKRMVESVATMLQKLSKIRPIMLVINRFQIASRSTMEVVSYLLQNPSNRIGIVLGANESQRRKAYVAHAWEEIVDVLKNRNQVYHIGTTGVFLGDTQEEELMQYENQELTYQRLCNSVKLLDYELVFDYMSIQYKKFRAAMLEESQPIYISFFMLYVEAAIMTKNFSKALEVIANILRYTEGKELHDTEYQCAYHTAVCYMYQGKLEEAFAEAKKARQEAELLEDDYLIFKAELLRVQNQMSGWYDIFFMVKDIAIEDSLLEQLIRYDYRNHLAHVYIYAYDNRPEVAARAYRSEAAVAHFGKGIAIAKELGNEQLMYNAYQKNIMIASTNGMNEIALIYTVRMYQSIRDKHSLKGIRAYYSLGYNLNAMGHTELAEKYYNRALELLYELRETVDIAEVYYNLSLNYMMREEYTKAGAVLDETIKIIEQLQLNSIRVCNISKIYALMALSAIMQKQQFNCERYLKSCNQFLSYITENGLVDEDDAVVHDYRMFDDDLFLYWFAKGRLHQIREEFEEALEAYDKAEQHMRRAEGNQFFIYKRYRECRMELFESLGKTERYEMEKLTLEQHMEVVEATKQMAPLDIVNEIDCGEGDGKCRVSPQNLDLLLKKSGLEVDYLINQKRLAYLSDWQKLLDQHMDDLHSLVNTAIWNLLNYFEGDAVAYIRYSDTEPEVLFNNTGITLGEEQVTGIRKAVRNYAEGFVVSKISDNYYEHLDMVSYFKTNEICSFVAVPCYGKDHLEAVFVFYVRMKDNLHSMTNRYMLDESDLNIYRLLFRELNNSVNRLLANNKIKEMNQQLEQNAVTDMLTGLYNRSGMYREAKKLELRMKNSREHTGIGLMFLDLDNFKPYNDTYGHDIGDIVLQGMAAIFRDVAGEKGFVSRYGGDEFIIIWNTSDHEELEQYAKSIYDKIDEADGFRTVIQNRLGKQIEINQNTYIGCSIGIATSELADENSVDALIKKADDVLYCVKTKSKGTYAFI